MPLSKASADYKLGRLFPHEKNKLRKPMVEKMRRDRINSCIEQLKVLLEEEFEKQQGSSKLEKADILEMTVGYLRQHQQLQLRGVPSFLKTPQQDYTEGYSSCLQETLHFLSLHERKVEVQKTILKHFHPTQNTAEDQNPAASSFSSPSMPIPQKHTAANSSSPVWRPW
ncbi:transcription factor HES-5-like [Protopterus annectens]|uniref:transcription factor HES-5-like n=1 Tax=Protopterus annectens TaxID=7888 RepID=UPI001CFB4A27|nr:transcription factor HES-5-like [Protopterus annectens]